MRDPFGAIGDRAKLATYRPGLLRLMESSENGLVALNATIVGGGERPDGHGRLGDTGAYEGFDRHLAGSELAEPLADDLAVGLLERGRETVLRAGKQRAVCASAACHVALDHRRRDHAVVLRLDHKDLAGELP
jgi:hypothetical protein